jgi:DnaJ-class molecular chaperone
MSDGPCPYCEGKGFDPDTGADEVCDWCEGSGRSDTMPCPFCDWGVVYDPETDGADSCEICNGTGIVPNDDQEDGDE